MQEELIVPTHRHVLRAHPPWARVRADEQTNSDWPPLNDYCILEFEERSSQPELHSLFFYDQGYFPKIIRKLYQSLWAGTKI